MADPKTYVPAPPRQPRPHTSLQTLPVIDGAPGPHLAVQFIPDPCAFPNPLPQDCWVTMGPDAGTLKTFGEGFPTVVSDNFGAYQGVECWLSGGFDEFSGVAERVLRAGEYKVVDAALGQLLSATATATTPASVGGIAGALAALEQALAAGVPAQGYILMGAAAATIAAAEGLFAPPGLDGALHTWLGTPVVVVTDLSATWTGTPPTKVSFVMFAAGPITVWRGPIVASEAPEVELNTGRALAERLYSVAIECGAWKVTADVPIATQTPTSGGGTPEPLVMLLGSIPSSPIPDGTDTTLVVHTNRAPDEEIYIKYSISGGPWQTTPELTQVTPTEYVHNVVGGDTTSGDTVALYAISGSIESNHIEIEVT